MVQWGSGFRVQGSGFRVQRGRCPVSSSLVTSHQSLVCRKFADVDGFGSFFAESRVQVVDAGPGEDSTGDGEPGGEDRTRYDGCRHGSEVDLGKTGGEAGILHADFDGEGDGFLPGEAAELGYAKT